MALAWFLRVFSNSSSFSAILRSISCLFGQAQVGHEEPCFPLLPRHSQPLLKQLEVLPSQPQDDGVVYPIHELTFHHLPVDQVDP